MNAHYASVFTKSAGEILMKMRPAGIPDIDEVCLDEARVRTTIERLTEQSAPGPDTIPNKLIKETMAEVAKPLSILFNKSMRERKIPDEWRVSNIAPIYKKGPKSEPGNYRPVNLTSSVCKLMERIVKDELEVHLERNGLIGTSQHGFRRGRSPVTNLIEFMEKLTTWMQARPFDIVYCDFFEGIQQSMPQKLDC